MYLIVGLGNPESEYENTRHNMGFHTINQLAQDYQISVTKNKFKGYYGTGVIEGQKVILLKPQTYMNLSGESIQEVMHFFQIEPKDILVIYDDMDIEKGMIKIRKKGGPGNHNGMKSIVQQIGTQEFPRIRIGIGSPEDKTNMIYYVIGPIPKEEKEILQQGVKKAEKAVIKILQKGLDSAMNEMN